MEFYGHIILGYNEQFCSETLSTLNTSSNSRYKQKKHNYANYALNITGLEDQISSYFKYLLIIYCFFTKQYGETMKDFESNQDITNDE